MAPVSALNSPVPATCPHCGSDQAELMPKLGDCSDYYCPECEEFSISGTQEAMFENDTDDPRSARFVADAKGRRWLKP